MITKTANIKEGQYASDTKSLLMMSTLMIQPLVPVYGTPVVAHTLGAYLKDGWNIYLLTAFKPSPVNNDLAKQLHISWFGGALLNTLRIFGDRVRKIGFFARAICWWISQILFFMKGFWIIRKHRIRLIYSWDVNAAPAAWLLSKLFGIPWMARYLGAVSMWEQMKNVAWRVRLWQQFIAYRLSADADLVIMTDDGTFGDLVLEKLGVDKSKIRFWMNGVEKHSFSDVPTKEIAKRRLGIKSDYVLLAVSRLDLMKKVDRIISVMPEVIIKIPETMLMIVGDGPERCALEKLARGLGVADHVRFVGAVPHEDVTMYYVSCDVFLSMYDISNVGNPLLEAMLAGKCCVALDVGGTSNILEHGKRGILISREQLNYLGQVIINLFENPMLRERLGINARDWACQNLKSWGERLKLELQEVEKLLLTP